MLALWQANFISQLLKNHGLDVTLSVIKTTGDMVQDRFLHEIGGKGLFIKELEEAMRAGRADLAMHSLKDLPVRLPEGFKLAAILERHTATDCIIFRQDTYKTLGITSNSPLGPDDLRKLGPLKVATSSLRRQALLTGLASGIEAKAVRGNVDTRLKKLEDKANGWDALVLAEASIERLDFKGLALHRLDPTWFVPCAGQGALAVETPTISAFLPTIRKINCPATELFTSIERQVLRALGGDCTMPFGCLVARDPSAPGHILGRVVVLDMTGREARAAVSLPEQSLENGETITQMLLAGLRADGVNDRLAALGLSQRIS